MIQHAPTTANNVPVYLPQLSAARPRGGLRNLGELVECLIRTYEAQARVLESYSARPLESAAVESASGGSKNQRAQRKPASPMASHAERQVTFDWYQNRCSGR